MGREAHEEAESTTEQFKSNVFANDPKLYFELFEKKERDPMEGLDIEEMTIETQEDVERAMSELKRLGFS
jgi:hypothetical protein